MRAREAPPASPPRECATGQRWPRQQAVVKKECWQFPHGASRHRDDGFAPRQATGSTSDPRASNKRMYVSRSAAGKESSAARIACARIAAARSATFNKPIKSDIVKLRKGTRRCKRNTDVVFLDRRQMTTIDAGRDCDLILPQPPLVTERAQPTAYRVHGGSIAHATFWRICATNIALAFRMLAGPTCRHGDA